MAMALRTLVFISVFFLFYAGIALSQDANIVEGPGFGSQEELAEPDTQWVWGEVVSVDTSGKLLTVKYLDYDTDTDREIVLEINDKTTFENTGSLAELKQGDNVGVDYMASGDGKNIASNIAIENPVNSEVPAQPTIEPVPEMEMPEAADNTYDE